jgi:benzoylformate decarboxylase
VRQATERHDLLISVGGDMFTESLATDVDPIAPGNEIIHIDTDPWQIAKNYPTACGLLGDPAAVLPELHLLVERRIDDGMRARIARRGDEAKAANRERRDALIARADAQMEAAPIPPLSLLRAIGEMLPADAIVVEELLSSLPGLPDLLTLEDECSYFGLRGGGIGAALPQAIGIKFAQPERPVVALVGDGSAMFSFQALWTAAHERVPVTFVIFNNASYRILKQRTLALGGHAARTGRLVAMDIDDPPVDFVALAGAMGVPATRVDSIAAFGPAFAEALVAGSPQLIDVVIDGAVDSTGR